MIVVSSHRRGGGLIEVLVAVTILVLIVVGVSNLYRAMIRSTREVVRTTQAQLLAEEGIEAVRLIRDTAWSGIASTTLGVEYGLVWSGATWSLVAASTTVGEFDRGVTFSNVYRDASDDIAPSGSLDQGMRYVEVEVVWDTSYGTTSYTLSSYIGNIFE